MAFTRKELLAGATAAGILAGCGGSSKPTAAAPAQFALDPRVRHFDAFLLASHPRPVREAIERHRRGLDADPAGYLREHEQALDEAVAEAGGRYLEVNPQDLAFTDSTTMGLGLVYGSVALHGRRDELLTTEHDHYATHESLRLRAARDGLALRRIQLYDDPARATVDSIVEAVRSGVSGRTGVLALTWVHSSTGVKLPLQQIAAAVSAHRRDGMLLVVDGVHALGVEDEPIRIETMDVLVAGCHKWLGGPRGTGLVWSMKAWDALAATIPTFDIRAYIAWIEGRVPRHGEVPPGAAFTPGGFHSFEHRWALAQAFDHQRELGRAKTAERIHRLATRLKEGLADIRHVRLITPMSPSVSAGIVCFDVDGMDPGEAVDRLRQEHRIAATVTPYAERHVRLGTGLWVDEQDVDAVVDAVNAL